MKNVCSLSDTHNSGGSRISRGGDVDLIGGVDSRGDYFSKILYVKMKEFGFLGGRAPGTPHLDPPMYKMAFTVPST